MQQQQLLQQAVAAAPPPAGMHAAPVVEVQLSLPFTAAFGTHLAVVSSTHGWQTGAAAAMAWSPGDVWSTVLALPAG